MHAGPDHWPGTTVIRERSVLPGVAMNNTVPHTSTRLFIDLCRMTCGEVSHPLQSDRHLLPSVLRVLAMGCLVAQVKPSGNTFLIELRIGSCSGEFRIDCVSLLWCSPAMHNGHAALLGKLSEMLFKNGADYNRSRVFVPLLEQIVRHIEEVGKNVPMN